MLYKCKRCGFTSDQKNGLRRHLNKKMTCKPLLMDINIDTLKYDLEEKSGILNPCESKLNPKQSNQFNSKSKYICSYCNKSYSTSSNMCKHMKNCKEKKKAESEAEKVKIENDKIAVLEAEIAKVKEEKEAEMALKEKERLAEIAKVKEEKEAEIAQKEKERVAEIALKEAEMALIKQQMELLINHTKEEMEKQKEFLMNHIETLMKHAGSNNTNNNNTTNNDNSTNIDNKQINIHINGFGNEDTSYITDRHFREWFNGPFSAITNCIEAIHFNPQKPQNWNTKIVDDKTSKALIYNAEKEMWVKREKKEIINRMVEKSYNMLDNNFEIQKEANTLDEKGKRKFENFMKIYDAGSKELDKRYETEVREMLLNHKEYHIETD